MSFSMDMSSLIILISVQCINQTYKKAHSNLLDKQQHTNSNMTYERSLATFSSSGLASSSSSKIFCFTLYYKLCQIMTIMCTTWNHNWNVVICYFCHSLGWTALRKLNSVICIEETVSVLTLSIWLIGNPLEDSVSFLRINSWMTRCLCHDSAIIFKELFFYCLNYLTVMLVISTLVIERFDHSPRSVLSLDWTVLAVQVLAEVRKGTGNK